jgi:prolyl-tRNA editing enzyme YbaK/EbsC (Cys-tRNA(Pro) deacylase)
MGNEGATDDIEARVLVALNSSGEPFEIIDCDPALADTAAFCAAYGYSPDSSANTIVAIGKADPPIFVACIALATTRLDINGIVRRRLEVRKASFAPSADTAAITGMQIGGVTPFALPATIPIWVDGEVTRRDQLILGGGSRSIKVLCPPRTLLAMPNVTVIEGLATAVVSG